MKKTWNKFTLVARIKIIITAVTVLVFAIVALCSGEGWMKVLFGGMATGVPFVVLYQHVRYHMGRVR